MSEFQLALVAAGLAAVGSVWTYNLWQERRHRKAAERLFKSEHADALLGGSDPVSPAATAAVQADSYGDLRVEPRLLSVDAQDSPRASAGIEAELAAIPPTSVVTETVNRVAGEDLSPWSDPMIDCIVRFDLPSGVPAPAIWAVQSLWSGQLGKSLRWLARDGVSDPWRCVGPSDDGHFKQWLTALQLADRRGAVSDTELGIFLDGMHQLAAQLDITIALPGRSETLRRAQELDAFCASVDIQFSLHVIDVQGSAFAGSKLRGVFEAAGLVLESDGCFHARNANGGSEFWVANMGSERFDPQTLRSLATQGVTLTLDVPRVADGVAAFDRMVATARQFERGLGGKLVDAQRTPLADAMIKGIRGKTADVQEALLAAGIAPGHLRAMKLFA